MAGRGPQPKDPNKRASHSKSNLVAFKVVHAEPTRQPKLPVLYLVDAEGKKRRFAWPAQTKTWWQMWADSPLSEDFTATDWSELLDTALLHARFWSGETKLAAELRLRVAKFGATPEDRARLRITFAAADAADPDDDQLPKRSSSRERRGPLQAVPDSN